MLENDLIVFIAKVKYPDKELTYLTADSYVVKKRDIKALSDAYEHFKSGVETQGFTIVDSLVYAVPRKQIAETVIVRNEERK